MSKYKTMKNIINNNYSVRKYFDDVPDGIASAKHLSKTEADEKLKSKKHSIYTSYKVVEDIAIIAIVPFNKGVAYVFNKQYTNIEISAKVAITYGSYEELMDCYVYRNGMISKTYLERLEKEYYDRGGVVYDKYHTFEEIVLKIERARRNEQYINEIVFDNIFKHGFREVGKRKWSNGDIVIKEKQTQRIAQNYPYNKTHIELNTNISNRMFIGSVFGKYYKHINQLSENIFGVVCYPNSSSSRYYFGYYEVEFKQ